MIAKAGIDLPSALISRYSRIDSVSHDDRLFGSGAMVPDDEYVAALAESAGQPERRSLYVHLPFCPVRCLACDSNAVITHNRQQIDRYLDHLEREIGLLARHLGRTVGLQQLHLGGGSPNYLSDRQLVRLMAMIDDAFVRDDATDCSLDANPRRTSPSQLVLLRSLGFERIFFGLRDLEPDVQLAIGRQSSFEMIEDVFAIARDAGFTTVGTDMLYGLPCQTTGGVQHTIESLLTLSPDRITCKAFTRRAAERAHQSAIDSCRIPSLADKLAQFNAILQGLSDDYQWIGLDSFARHDDELAHAQADRALQRNWIGYSHLPTTHLYGIGTNAISDMDSICVQNFVELDPWEDALGRDRLPVRGGVRLSEADRRQRQAIKRLMCNHELSDHRTLFDSVEDEQSAWAGFARDGLLSVTSGAVRLTNEGRCLLPHLLVGASPAPIHPL